jgi:uncharacterized protein YcaQ
MALAAQGFADPRPSGRIDRRHGRRVLDRVGVVQIDSVNVVCRSQELPLFARLGRHRRDLVPRMTEAGDVFEYWAHEASHVPVDLHPLLRWRMADARDGVGTWGRVAEAARRDGDRVAAVLGQVTDEGPLTVGMLRDGGARSPGMWGWSPGKVALEYLFWSGQISARRGPNFERWYDLTERLLPAEVLARPTPRRADALRELLVIAARCHGLGTARDLADYFRLRVGEARPLLADLVADERLLEVAVEGWRETAYLHPGARVPRRVRARALLSPFDSLIWERSRTERLWGFRYRVEIYVPAPDRVHGYYVLPFLLGDHLVARVDLKADRAAAVLRVRGAHGEPGIDVEEVCGELAAELEELAVFLGLGGEVVVEPSGDLADPLAGALRRRP